MLCPCGLIVYYCLTNYPKTECQNNNHFIMIYVSSPSWRAIRTSFSSVRFSRSVVSDSLRPHESQLCHQIKWQWHYLQISQLERRTLMGKEIRNSLSWCLYQKTNLKNIRGQEKWPWAGEVGVEGWAVFEVTCRFNSQNIMMELPWWW